MADPRRSPGISGGDMLTVATPARRVYADNLKVVLVCGVIIAHVTMAWAALKGAWVFRSRRSAIRS
jgi:hypothetical protein